MAQFNFTREEIAALIEVLQSDQSELRMEIAGTDRMEFRDHLKHTKVLIQSIIDKLQKSIQEEGVKQPITG